MRQVINLIRKFEHLVRAHWESFLPLENILVLASHLALSLPGLHLPRCDLSGYLLLVLKNLPFHSPLSQ